jgi:pyruvate/2-oxoglutarate dehydrogenase complex dihydrolipoamide acyltransferase (E2) component
MVFPVGDPLDFQQPAPGEQNGFALSRGVKLRGDKHDGLDLTNRASGGEVRAVAPGLVVATRTGWGGGWGNMVVLAHRLPGGDLLFSLVAHLLPGSITVREGEVVALGQPLGRIGSTGHSSGPHLHLEFREMAGTRNPLDQPLAMAWMKATIVDPLRLLSTMMPRPSGNPFLAALPAANAAPAASIDPVVALVQRGALAPSAFEHPDDGLTRGELYRIAFRAMARGGESVPARWSTLRPRLIKRAATLPAAARAQFAAARLPIREAQASTPAGLGEVIAVFTTLERAGVTVPRGVKVAAAVTDRRTLDERFPHGLLALEQDRAPAVAPQLPGRFVGPPAVSRRQAALLWAYLESGRAPAPGSAAAAELP